MYDVYVFEATLTTVSGGRLGIYVPKDLEHALSKHKGKKVYIHIYAPKG